MPSSSTFTGIGLKLQSVAQIAGTAQVRVRFTQDPRLISPVGVNDGLNPSNYSLAGAISVTVTSVATVPDDSQAVTLILSEPLTAGTWTLTVSAALQTLAGDTIQPPLSMAFTALGFNAEAPVNGGANNDDAESILRKHLNSALKGKGWNALIAAIAVGDKLNWDLAKAAFDQLFKSSASGVYLDRKCGDDGVSRPISIGMSDDLYRKLGIKVTASKLTHEVLLEILEVFYGSDALRAFVSTETFETRSLNDGDWITVNVDEREDHTIVFTTDDFSNITKATAIEVANCITRQLQLGGSRAFAVASKDPVTGKFSVRIYSGALGLASSIRVTGGIGQKALCFEHQIGKPKTSNPALLVWDLTIPQAGTLRLKVTGTVPYDFNELRIGDYAVITAGSFNAANRGSYRIQKVDVRYVGATLEQYIEVLNDAAVAQAGVAQLTVTDVLFFRPVKKAIHTGSQRTVVLTQTKPRELDISIPATTQAVSRTLHTGAFPQDPAVSVDWTGPYLMDQDGLAITSVETTTAQDVFAGHQYTTLKVADATDFPDEEGWVVLAFGFKTQAAPIRYIGKIGNDTLILDYQQKMPKTNLSGVTSVILLQNKGAFVPVKPETIGMAYLTASPAGRVAAQAQLEKAVAAGIEMDFTVVYPGDRGLGGEGLGTTGRKISDKVAVWGSDDLDTEISKARGK